MKIRPEKINKSSLYRILLVVLSIVLNVVLSFLTYSFGIPIYLDTIGTILVSTLCGLFPGIITAVVTSFLCVFFNEYSVFFTLISVLIAMASAWFAKRELYKKRPLIPVFIFILSLLGGVLGTMLQWLLIGHAQFFDIRQTADLLAGGNEGLEFIWSVLLNIGINLIDKAASVGLAVAAIYLIPEKLRSIILSGGWLQAPLSDAQIKKLETNNNGKSGSLMSRMTLMLTIVTLSVAIVIGYTSITLYMRNATDEYEDRTQRLSDLVASVINPELVDDYLDKGYDAQGFKKTSEILYNIGLSLDGTTHIYAISPEKEGKRYLFDISMNGEEHSDPGDYEAYTESDAPLVSLFLEGLDVDPQVIRIKDSVILTAYSPVKDYSGHTVCYAVTQVSMNVVSEFMKEYLVKLLLAFSGFFVFILGYGFWVSSHRLVYPIGSMARCAEGFMKDIDDQDKLDERVRKLRKLDIHTGDEIERLYRDICDMASGTAEQMRDIRYYADANNRMQSGLIVTMADMVESRDSDTGAHVQKTAAYVRIILDGLKERGYYAEKLTPKYITAVEMSAPLHDVGKINISDVILNKPGKLTDEEFEIMKTHTTEGKKIMEQAISTVNGESYLKEARNMAAYHHERWDGKGYPEGLHGQVIPLSARIMAVADVFDALTSKRVYKPPFPLEKAVEILQDGAGTQFDPKCVEVFIDALPKVKHVLKKYQEA